MPVDPTIRHDEYGNVIEVSMNGVDGLVCNGEPLSMSDLTADGLQRVEDYLRAMLAMVEEMRDQKIFG